MEVAPKRVASGGLVTGLLRMVVSRAGNRGTNPQSWPCWRRLAEKVQCHCLAVAVDANYSMTNLTTGKAC